MTTAMHAVAGVMRFISYGGCPLVARIGRFLSVPEEFSCSGCAYSVKVQAKEDT